jgi:hypothetical protein
MCHEDDDDGQSRTAAIVCEHVARGTAPILLAEKSEPQEEADSGWQFLCGTHDENWEDAQVWALHEVLSLEPSLRAYLDVRTGTVLSRRAEGEDWVLESA